MSVTTCGPPTDFTTTLGYGDFWRWGGSTGLAIYETDYSSWGLRLRNLSIDILGVSLLVFRVELYSQ